MARENRPADPDRVGALLARVFSHEVTEAEQRIAGLNERFPLDPDLDAKS